MCEKNGGSVTLDKALLFDGQDCYADVVHR